MVERTLMNLPMNFLKVDQYGEEGQRIENALVEFRSQQVVYEPTAFTVTRAHSLVLEDQVCSMHVRAAQ